jgi:hypothetical protein
MKRVLILLSLSLLITLAVGLVAVVGERDFVDMARAELMHYASGASVIRMVRASRPWNLTREMSAATFGSSARYTTSRGASSRPATPGPDLLQGDTGRPLPYPPEELWCAQLANAGESRPWVVFVAYHQDLYNGAWIVHEPVAALLDQSQAALGCDWLKP